MNEKSFFHVELQILEDKKVFPFHIYVYNPMTKEYNAFLWGNDPLIKSKKEILEFIVGCGGSIAISMDQKRTFLTALELNEEDVPSLRKQEEKQSAADSSNAAEKLKELDEQNGRYAFKEEFAKCVEEENFTPMIQRARMEISALSVRETHTVSLARHLAETLLYQDNLVNRVVAISYFLAKNCDIKDDESLGDLVCAGFFHHLGATQLDYTIWQKATTEHFDKERKYYKQHPGLSQHLLRKSSVELSPRCMTLILQHHERYDGSGYPDMKKGEHLDILSLILGAVGHMMEFNAGKISGSPMKIPALINAIKEKSAIVGLEYQFGPLIEQNIANIFNTGKAKTKDELENERLEKNAKLKAQEEQEQKVAA